jgi:hypothetical protein
MLWADLLAAGDRGGHRRGAIDMMIAALRWPTIASSSPPTRRTSTALRSSIRVRRKAANERRRAIALMQKGGGEAVAQGAPEQIARNPKSYAGAYLKPVLARAKRSAAEQGCAYTAESTSALIFASYSFSVRARSYWLYKLSQKAALGPTKRLRRRAVSGEIPRLPLRISVRRLAGTRSFSASAFAVRPRAVSSPFSTAPGCAGSNAKPGGARRRPRLQSSLAGL